MAAKRKIGQSGLKRFPLYLRELVSMREAGKRSVSGSVMARALNLDPILVRKDLALTGVRGIPRVGFRVEPLIRAINLLLGLDMEVTGVLAGVGKLGSALLCYKGFREHGFSVAAAFDAAPERCNIIIDGIPVFPVNNLTQSALRMNASVGILTVPSEQAQQVANQMVAGGIRAIWNFAPVQLTVPEGVVVKQEDLAVNLAVLLHQLKEQD